jgi:Tfp pilus assembly protein PilX
MKYDAMNSPAHHRSTQSGALALIAAVLLLFSSSIAVLYLNRSLIFEQRTSSNQTKSTLALQMAEAGIEWATGMLNTPYDIQESDCSLLSTTNLPFSRRYVQSQWTTTTNVVSVTNTFPGCKVSGTTLSCNCPTVTNTTTAASLGTSTLPGFTVAFSDVAGDAESVKITSTGCTALDTACYSSTKANADASASASVILKLRPFLRSAPVAPLTCRQNCVTTATPKIFITNTDLSTNGMLVHTGSSGTILTTTAAVSRLTTIPGVDPLAAISLGDQTLNILTENATTCANGVLFNQHFGMTLSQYANQPQVKSITCSSASASACVTSVTDAYNEGWRSFYFPAGFFWDSNNSLGSQAEPVTIVATGSTLSGVTSTGTIAGLVYYHYGSANGFRTSSSPTFQGAFVACMSYNVTNTAHTVTFTYDPIVLTNIRRSVGSFVRVPGSWKDF